MKEPGMHERASITSELIKSWDLKPGVGKTVTWNGVDYLCIIENVKAENVRPSITWVDESGNTNTPNDEGK